MSDFISDGPDKDDDGLGTSAQMISSQDMNDIRSHVLDLESDISDLEASDVALDGRLDTAESTLTSLDSRLDAQEAAPSYTALGSAAANWTKGTGNDAPRYYKRDGRVYLTGLVNYATGGGDPVFTSGNGLPAGYRPLATRFIPCAEYNADDDALYSAILTVGSDGSLQFLAANNVAKADGDIYYFDGASFLAEQ